MYAVLTYGFPIILAAFEAGLRFLLGLDTKEFVGPTFAAVGLSFLMPLTKPKKINVTIPGYNNAVVTTKADSVLVPIVWVFVFAFLLVWCWTVYTAVKTPTDSLLGWPTHWVIGFSAYAVSLALTRVKEAV